MVAMEDNDRVTLFHEDILEPILSHVPLVDLAPASHVSKLWHRSVRNSLRYLNKPKPWLLVHTQSIWSPRTSATHAYDPRSQIWIRIKSPSPVIHPSALRSSDSNLLYTLLPMKFSFSLDPLRMTWHHVASPTVWRDDPVVSLVGRKIVVAGGVCDFEDDLLAVEAYDLDTGTWSTCRSMPESLRDSGMLHMLSVSTDGEQMYITEKNTGEMHVFHPEKNVWSGPHRPCPDHAVFFSVTACMGGQLILIGLAGGNVMEIKLWGVDTSTFVCEPMGEMPRNLVEKLGRDRSVGVCYSGSMVYIYSPSDVEEVVTVEAVSGGGLRWGRVRNVVQGRSNMGERVVCTCAEVGLGDVAETSWFECVTRTES